MNFIRSEMALEGDEAERLASVIDSSLRVSNEEQFFSWSQSALQYLLSHEILICAIRSNSDAALRYYRFSSTRYFGIEHFNRVCDPSNGLLALMMSVTRRTGTPCVLSPGVTIGGCDPAWLPLLESCELRNVAAYGLSGSDGVYKSYFVFARIADVLNARIVYLLEVLIPIVDATLSRVLAYQEKTAEKALPVLKLLSKREIEILHFLMAGKTNQIIAAEMFISPLTVKNHVQNIMKKLQVKSRGHAVTKGLKFGLIKLDNKSQGDQNV